MDIVQDSYVCTKNDMKKMKCMSPEEARKTTCQSIQTGRWPSLRLLSCGNSKYTGQKQTKLPSNKIICAQNITVKTVNSTYTNKHILIHEPEYIYTYTHIHKHKYKYKHTYMALHIYVDPWSGIGQIFSVGPAWHTNYCLLKRCFFSNSLKHAI